MMGVAKKVVPLLGLVLIPLATAAAAGPAGPRLVASLSQQAGYREIRDIEFDDGLWEAEVRLPYGRWEEISTDPDTGGIYDLRGQRWNARDTGISPISLAMPASGMSRPPTAQGRRMELKVSGHDGRVLHSRIDD